MRKTNARKFKPNSKPVSTINHNYSFRCNKKNFILSACEFLVKLKSGQNPERLYIHSSILGDILINVTSKCIIHRQMPTFWSNLSYQVRSVCSRKRLSCVSESMTLVQLNPCLCHSHWWKNSSDQKLILHADPETRLCCICHSRFSCAFNSKPSAIAEAFCRLKRCDRGDV